MIFYSDGSVDICDGFRVDEQGVWHITAKNEEEFEMAMDIANCIESWWKAYLCHICAK